MYWNLNNVECHNVSEILILKTISSTIGTGEQKQQLFLWTSPPVRNTSG